jgi:hypothetical protein
MADPAFHAEQKRGVYATHVKPLNQLVDQLNDPRGRGWMPYVAPHFGGTEARLLLLLRDPGPGTNDQRGGDGSGFLCIENDDETAEGITNLLHGVELSASDCVGWNAYPWYIYSEGKSKGPTAAQLADGVGPLRLLLQLLPNLRAALLLGNHAQDLWHRLSRQVPGATRGVRPFATRLTSRQAFIGTVEKQRVWKQEQRDVFQAAADYIRIQ